MWLSVNALQQYTASWITFRYCNCHFAAVPGTPTGVSVEDGTECYTSVVSWTAPQSRCGVVIGNYSVRYRLKNGGGNYTTMYTDETSVTLGNITPNAAYDVYVVAISSQIGQFTEALQFELQGTLCMFCAMVHTYVCTVSLSPTPVSFTYICY